MKSKISFIILLSGLLLVQMFQSCNKYPESSGLSLRTRAERVANHWKVENYQVNGSDFTTLVNSYEETYTKQGVFDYDWGMLEGAGSWEFQNHDEEIKLNGNDEQSSRRLFIMKLEEKTFWYYYMEGNDKHELHLISN